MKRTITIIVLSLIFVSITAFAVTSVSQTAYYMNRGMDFWTAAAWTADDLHNVLIGEEKETEPKVKEYPMTNANVNWVLLYREP